MALKRIRDEGLYHGVGGWTDGPFKPWFGLSGAVLRPDKVFRLFLRVFVFVHFDSISSLSQPVAGFGSASNIPTQAKTGLELATRRILLPQQSMQSSSETVVRSSGSDRVLVIMAKAPRPGAVKTRLASSLSPQAVTEFYCCLLDDTLALARSLGNVEVAIMGPDSDVNELAQLAGNQASVVAQKGEGLAAALTSVFAHFAPDHQRDAHQRRIIAFNSDSPHLPRSVLEDAFETLAAQDVVVGPTHDGGYYLVGAKASHPTLFASDGMGTSTALESLLSRAQALELSVGFAAPFYDIDVVNDLTRLAEELRLAPARAPRTARWLIEWELAAGHSRTRSRTGTGKLQK